MTDDVRKRLTAYDQLALSVLHEHDCRFADSVVIASHGIVVCACAGYGQQIACCYLRKLQVPDEHVSALTALAGNGYRFFRFLIRPVRQRFIFRLVQRRARLSVIPPSTATYLRTPGISLLVPTVYRVVPASPTMLRPGSTQISGSSEPRPAKWVFTASVIAFTYWDT